MRESLVKDRDSFDLQSPGIEEREGISETK